MTEIELEKYLMQNGFDYRMAPEVWDTIKKSGIDLKSTPVGHLSVPNDSVRMDIRTVADRVSDRRQMIAKSRNIPLDMVPFRVYHD